MAVSCQGRETQLQYASLLYATPFLRPPRPPLTYTRENNTSKHNKCDNLFINLHSVFTTKPTLLSTTLNVKHTGRKWPCSYAATLAFPNRREESRSASTGEDHPLKRTRKKRKCITARLLNILLRIPDQTHTREQRNVQQLNRKTTKSQFDSCSSLGGSLFHGSAAAAAT